MESILKLFLRVNRKGTPVDSALIDKVAKELEELESGKAQIKTGKPKEPIGMV